MTGENDMKINRLFILATLCCVAVLAGEKTEQELAREIRHYQQKGEIAEADGSLKTAARCYHKIALRQEDARLKAEWFQREAECWFAAMKTTKAYHAYKHLLKNYPLYVSYELAIPHLRELAERYIDGNGTFWGLRDKSAAAEVYELLLRETPSIKVSLDDRVRLAGLYEELDRWEEAVLEYQEILSRSPMSDEIRLKFVKLLMRMSKRGDGDGQRLRTARRHALTILEHHPDEELRKEVEEILTTCREQEAQRLLDLAKFYLTKAQYRPEAAKGYLLELNSKFAGTAAAKEGAATLEELTK